MDSQEIEPEAKKRVRYTTIEEVARAESKAAAKRAKLLDEVGVRLDAASKSLAKLRDIAHAAGEKKTAKLAERALVLLPEKAESTT